MIERTMLSFKKLNCEDISNNSSSDICVVSLNPELTKKNAELFNSSNMASLADEGVISWIIFSRSLFILNFSMFGIIALTNCVIVILDIPLIQELPRQ